MTPRNAAVLAALALGASLATAQNANQGVSKTEITARLHPRCPARHQRRLRQAQRVAPGHQLALRVDEINDARQASTPYQASSKTRPTTSQKAVLAAQKLVNQDKIFAMVGHIGTAQNMACDMPVQFEKNVINFFPVTVAREMYEPSTS